MLPVATPPNAIVFASRQLSIAEMARAGIWMNLIGLAVIMLSVSLLLPAILR
jgi:sodium-dependent dicarboxylate transporter 2/3/5